MTQNPATVMRKLLEARIPPEQRIEDWDERWNDLERYCAQMPQVDLSEFASADDSRKFFREMPGVLPSASKM